MSGADEFENAQLKVMDYNRGIYVDLNEDNIGIYASSHHDKQEDLNFGLKSQSRYDNSYGQYGLSKFSRAHQTLNEQEREARGAMNSQYS